MAKVFTIDFAEAVATLIGAVIGAGVLAIPYVMAKAGFLTGLLNLAVLGSITLFVYLSLGEVILRTKGKYQLTGYAEKYIGTAGKTLMALCLILSTYGALVAYMMGVGRSLGALFPFYASFAGISLSSSFIFSVLFFCYGSALIYKGIAGVKKTEFFVSVCVVIIAMFISLFAFSQFNPANISSFDAGKLFLPYGVILFALSGAVALPEMREELKDKKQFRTAIVLGILIPIITYFSFSLAVVGACGPQTSEIAISCLADRFGSSMLWLGNIFAVLAMTTSFFTIGVGLREVFNYDYHMEKKRAWFFACVVPFLLFLFILLTISHERFFRTLDLTGGIMITIEGILLILMIHNSKKHGDRKPEYSIFSNSFLLILMGLVFLAGFVYSLLSYLGLLRI